MKRTTLALAGGLAALLAALPVTAQTVDGPRVDVLTRPLMRELIEPRSPESHKGDYGRLLIVAGSPRSASPGR